MSSKKKQGVKRTAPGNAVASAKRVEAEINRHNAMYGHVEGCRLICLTDIESIMRDSKLINYMLQYALDIHMVALHEEFGFAGKRQKRFAEKAIEVDQRFDGMKKEDLRDDPKAEYAIMKLEQALQSACGEYYVPRAERYHAKYYYKNELWDETQVDDADARMLLTKGEGFRDE